MRVKARDFFYDRRVARPAGPGPHHALEILLPFAAAAGAPAESPGILQLRPDGAFSWNKFFVGDARQTFVVFTDSRGAGKQWPHFQKFMQLLFEKMPDAKVAWCAGKLAQPEFSPPKERFLNLTGCALDEMIAVVRQPSVFIGNDSGPMHLSAATGNRVLAIFGPTSPRRFGPFPLESPRHLAVTAPQGDLAQLTPEAVFTGLEELRNRAL